MLLAVCIRWWPCNGHTLRQPCSGAVRYFDNIIEPGRNIARLRRGTQYDTKADARILITLDLTIESYLRERFIDTQTDDPVQIQ